MCQLSTHLVYFWMPISLGIESGRTIMKHMRKSAKRWSVYQWYGISPSVCPVTVSYRDRHTETHKQGEKYCFIVMCIYIYTFVCYSSSHWLILNHTHTTHIYPADPAQPPKRPQRSWRGWKQSRSRTDGRSSVRTPLAPHRDTCSADWLTRHSQEWPTHLSEIPETPEKGRKMLNCFKPHNLHILFQLYPH